VQYSDKPICRPADDALGRSKFALRLARAIDELSVAKEGFVIGVVGEWGAGKSSVIALVLRFLRHIEMERASKSPLIGERQAYPRTVDQLEKITESFSKFDWRLKGIVDLDQDPGTWGDAYYWSNFKKWLGTTAEADEVDYYWRLKLQIEKTPHTIIVRFSPWLIASRVELATALLSDLARAIGGAGNDKARIAFAKFFGRLSELLPIAGVALDTASGGAVSRLLTPAGKWLTSTFKEMSEGPTLDEVRQNLVRALQDISPQQILVVVDDLDRLTPSEALEMVSIVKGLGDLPNVIYLLSYSDTKLAELIDKATGVSGERFLEKIIQYPVALPPIDSAGLVGLFDGDVSGIVGPLTLQNQQRLNTAWHFVLSNYLTDPRKIRRFTNSVAVACSGNKDYLDPIEILLIETLRIAEPRVYWWIRKQLDKLVS